MREREEARKGEKDQENIKPLTARKYNDASLARLIQGLKDSLSQAVCCLSLPAVQKSWN